MFDGADAGCDSVHENQQLLVVHKGCPAGFKRVQSAAPILAESVIRSCKRQCWFTGDHCSGDQVGIELVM